MSVRTINVIRKTVAELAALAAGELDAQADGSHVIEGAAGLGEAGPKEASFLKNMKYAASAASSQAGCVFLPLSGKETVTLTKNRIYVEDPQWAFAQVLILIEALRPKVLPVVDAKASVHFQARLGPGVSVGAFTVLEKGVLIGENTVIGANCFLGANVKIGRNCLIHPGVVVREDCVVGDRCVLQPGAVVGSDGYGFATDPKTGKHRKIPQLGNVVVNDDVEIGANTAIDRATTGSTVIGAGTKIDNLVQIGHNVRMGRDCLVVSQAGVAGSCVIGDRVILAGQAGLAGHLHIGDGAVVMAQTGVMSDVEKGKMVFGSPAKPHREAFKLQALYGRLPEVFEAVKQVKEKLGMRKDVPEAR
jgi:UDP-3-O-[3-hydroxymyristoyl] glucosamine N-acyltransferase